jgi:endoglucanase
MGWPRWSIDEVLRVRPAVRVNQVGYLADRTKLATLVSTSDEPVDFVLLDGTGTSIFSGRSRPWPVRPEPTSGLPVHQLDFTGASAQGVGFSIRAGSEGSHAFAIGGSLYQSLARDAQRFFTLMRSGFEIPDTFAAGYGRPAGHVGRAPNTGDVRVPAWTGAEAERLYPGWQCKGHFDVSGGWYDAGDYGKYVTSGSIALWQLLNAVDLIGRRKDTRTFGNLASAIRDECRWQLDWLLRMQVPPGDSLAGMAFHRVHGTEWSPLPGWAHEDPTYRVLHRPSTTATLHLAAVGAQGARLFRAQDRTYAQRLLDAARRAYDAATANPRLLPPDDHCQFGGGAYDDNDVADDFYWAAAELWMATGEAPFRQAVLESGLHHADVFSTNGFDFNRVAAPARLDLALSQHQLPDRDRVRGSVVKAADRLLDLQAEQPWSQPYAPPDGWDWGSNGLILNNLVVVATADLLTGESRYVDAVATGIDYLLGRNALGQSYITGYGTDFTHHQRTRQFGHDHDPSFPPPPPGAICGGPNSKPSPDFPYDHRLVNRPPQTCYLDEPTSEVTNDVCIRWNAPLAWVAVYLSAP